METGINKNVAVVGAAGSGKTVSFVEPELIETLHSTEPMNRIVVLTKRRIADKYIPLYRKAGFRVYDLNFTDPEAGNCCYDPLAYVRCDEDITEQARSVVMVNDRKEHCTSADPFWDDASEAVLAALNGLALMTMDNPTFSDVLDIFYRMKFEESGSGISTSLDSAFKRIERAAPDSYALNRWKTFREAAPKTAKSIYVSLNSTLKAFTPSVRSCMKTKPTVDLEKMSQKKSILFITTSPVNRSLHSLANIFVSQAIRELFRVADEQPGGTLPIPFHITFDDFATGAKVADMPEKLSICREKGISFSLLLQSEAQLEKMYGHCGSVEILDNCDSYVFMGGNNFETAKSISAKMDVPVQKVLYMPVGQEIVFRRGQKPIVTSRYDVYNNEFYRED
jgi:type IV secretory pathway TraG/TraD family ATPase VirD4